MVIVPNSLDSKVSSAETLILYVDFVSKSGLIKNLTVPEIGSTEKNSKSNSDSIL